MRRAGWWFTLAVLVAAIVVVAILGVRQKEWKDRTLGVIGTTNQRAEVIEAAALAVPAIFGYDYRTIDGTLDDRLAHLTPRYADEFESSFRAEIIPQATERHLISEAVVVGAGVATFGVDTADLLVFLNQTITEPDLEPVYTGSRLRVVMKNVDDEWLIDDVEPV